jgi:ATP/maltotriose-dependent transcriptional regulator MalT
MNFILTTFAGIISSLAGFYLSYLLIRHRANKSYEPDFIRAQMELHKGNSKVALYYFHEVLNSIDAKNPFYISTLVGMSEAFMQKGEFEKARKYIKKALAASEPSNHKILLGQLNKLEQKIAAHSQLTLN